MLDPWKKIYDRPRYVLKARDITLPTLPLSPSTQSYGFSSSQVWIWELDHKEGWALKNWWFWIVALEKTLESLGLQGIQINLS